jgi:hypothetical protein
MRLRVLHSVAQTKRFTPENFPSKNDFSLRAGAPDVGRKAALGPTPVIEVVQMLAT